MPAAYDTYDYPSYWEGRDYEHESEIIAIKAFLDRISKIKTILEVGAGYGRLANAYIFRGKKITLTDPSSKLLKIARANFEELKSVEYIQSTLENLHKKIKASSLDLILIVRVLHHIEDIDKCLSFAKRSLKKNGYFIIEFANKRHLKAVFSQFMKGNFTFPIDIFPTDKRSPKSVKKNTLPFINYHPDIIKNKLTASGFQIIEIRSVSNFRSTLLKRMFDTSTLLTLEKYFQIPMAYIHSGPSIFILARKRG